MIREGYYFLKLRRNQWKRPEQIQKMQDKMVRNIVAYAYKNTRFYRDKLNSANIKPSDIKKADDLRKIPITTKNEIRDNFWDIIVPGYNETNCVCEQTTGSTGKILQLLHDKPAYSYFMAVAFRMLWGWGCRFQDKISYIRHEPAGRRIYEKFGILRRQYISIFDSERDQIKALKKFNTSVLDMYPSIALSIINIIDEKDLEELNLKFINLNSELLTKKTRALVKSTFNCEVYDEYSTYEVHGISEECSEHRYHIISDNVAVNFLDENENEVASGESGRIIVTSLVNKAMPFIRYEIGDVGMPSDEKCTCGRGFPLMKMIEGRKDDFISLPSGRIISPRRIVPLIEITPGIIEFQISQEKIDEIVILIVKNEIYSKAEEEKMFKRINRVIKEPIKLEIKFVDRIPRKRGKLRIIVSKIKR